MMCATEQNVSHSQVVSMVLHTVQTFHIDFLFIFYNTRVLVRKNLWKKVFNEKIPVNKYQKKINHMSKLKEMMLIILKR